MNVADFINNVSTRKIRSKYEIHSLLLGLLISGIFLAILNEINFLLFFSYIVLAIIGVIVVQGQYIGGNVRVTEKNFPELKKIIQKQAAIAQVPEPDLFVLQSPELQAFTLGYKHPYMIVIHSSIIESFTAAETEVVIAHELGHAYHGHTKILSILWAIQNMPLDVLFLPIQIAFYFYARQCEVTSDRFAVCMTQNPRGFVKVITKLAVGPKLTDQIDEIAFLNQSLEIQKNRKYQVGEWYTDHPYNIHRVAYTIRFSNENGIYYRRGDSVYCINCGTMVSLPAKYCVRCGWVINT